MATSRQRAKRSASRRGPDFEKFRLRHFVEKLIGLDEVEIHEQPVDLADVSPIVEATRKAVLFRKAGPEAVELAVSVMGSRRRVAAAFGVGEKEVVGEFQRRLANPQPVVVVPTSDAPVQQLVLSGDQADLSRLPFHPQHAFDGSVYLTSGIDFTIDPETGLTNVGCRRLSLRGRQECGTNVTGRSHLKQIYMRCAARGERLPISFAVGSHPVDFMASGMTLRNDETTLVGTLRGEPLPLVKSLTNDIRVPADAEMIIEGYLHEHGYTEPEGPYGEYMGYYGPMHLDPVFHLTAITMRRDAMYQSLLHGSGRILGRTESANLAAIRLEADAFRILRGMNVDVVDVHQPLWSGEGQHLRIAIRPAGPDQSRRVIAAILAAMPTVKHVFVVDDDIDVRSEDAMEWALGTRFQADRDLVRVEGLRGLPMDPSLDGRAVGVKAGFDLTRPFGRPWTLMQEIVGAKRLNPVPAGATVREALEAGPLFFTQIMERTGSRDGREVALALNELRRKGKLGRDADGRYHLVKGKKGRTVMVGPAGPDPNWL